MLAIGVLLLAIEGTSFPDVSQQVVYPKEYTRGIVVYPWEEAKEPSYRSEAGYRSVAPPRTTKNTGQISRPQEIHNILHFPDGRILNLGKSALARKQGAASAEDKPATTGAKNYNGNYPPTYPGKTTGSMSSYAPRYPNYSPSITPQESYTPEYPNYISGATAKSPYAPSYTNYAPGYPSYSPGVPPHTHFPSSYAQYYAWYYYMMSQRWRHSHHHHHPIQGPDGWYSSYYGYRPYGGPGAYSHQFEGSGGLYDGYGRPGHHHHHGSYGYPGGFGGVGGPYGWDDYEHKHRPHRPHKHHGYDYDDDDDDDYYYDDDDEEEHYYSGGHKHKHGNKRKKHPYYQYGHYPNDYHYPYDKYVTTKARTNLNRGATIFSVEDPATWEHPITSLSPQNMIMMEQP